MSAVLSHLCRGDSTADNAPRTSTVSLFLRLSPEQHGPVVTCCAAGGDTPKHTCSSNVMNLYLVLDYSDSCSEWGHAEGFTQRQNKEANTNKGKHWWLVSLSDMFNFETVRFD